MPLESPLEGTVARVNIGQPIMSIRSSDKYKAAVIELSRIIIIPEGH